MPLLQAIVASILVAAVAHAQEPATGPARPRREPSYESLAALLGPVRSDDPRDLQRCVDLAAKLQGDPRLFPFDVHVEINERGPGLAGYVLFREQQNPVRSLVNTGASISVWDRVTAGSILPGLQYAIVSVDRAALRNKPEPGSEMVTQVSRGDPLFLLEQRGGHFRCMGPDGYCGFISATDLERIDADKLTATLNAKPASDRIEPAIDKAMSLQGTPYVWGGTSASGIDCSGLVQASFRTIGINLPRDADQQVYAGRLVATRWHRDALRRGDLLFFLGRRGSIVHVAIYVGESKYIEASDTDVHVSSFDRKDDNYSERRDLGFAFGKRVLD